ncbi:serine hydrolase domain-containing protein [Planctomyces sp. SH-PL62]|uniref:serine hydrolase domain-containing protein n=1 Tax=Planctomyces sp. SH-PL62 TaxID=1636152 RepID=UPI00078E1EF9|nr:serine hydrolase domain-containing protein [Planctomyces sp. SH-PL62]AMV40804.1 Penicillin-binding protein 4* [Planctomyces sp. SH-PL62]
MRFMTAAILLGVAAAVAPAARAQDPAPPPSAAEIDAYIEKAMRDRHVPGLSAAVVRDGQVVLAKGYGLADVEQNVPATVDTVYQLASVTKTFTSAAVMLLVREGKLALDDKINDRLPDLPAVWKDVTVRHLLNHTSGIKSYTSVPDFQKSPWKDYAHRELLDLVAKEPLEFAPGEKFEYSNTGYYLLGMLIEKASGEPYGRFTAARVFEPLGMSRTRLNDLQAIIPGRARGYRWDRKELENVAPVSPTQPFAAGALVSSVSDLIKWDAALAEHELLDEATLGSMWTPTRLNGGGESGYGFGWEVSKVNGRPMVAHGGGIPGFSTQLSRFPDDRLTVIVLTNAEGGHAGALARGIAGRFAPGLAPKPEEPITDEDEATSRRLRGMMEGATKGEFDPDLFTAEANERLVPRIKDDKERLASFGALKSFELLERKADDEGTRLRYRAVFESQRLKVSFMLDKEGKIRGAGIQPED